MNFVVVVVELRAADLMNQLLQMNEKARKTEELLEKMEKERYGKIKRRKRCSTAAWLP